MAETVPAALATRAPEEQRPVVQLAEEEGRLGRVSLPRRAWAPPGVRPRASGQIVRASTSVSAAVAPAAGNMTSVGRPTANPALRHRCWEPVSPTCADSFRVRPVDRAGWQGAKALVIPDHMRLIPPPASRPELNPVDHIWEDLREKPLPNLVLPALEAVSDQVCDGLRQ